MIGANSLFEDDLPIHKEIVEAAKQAGVEYPADQMTEGWIGGMAIEAALKAPAGPRRREDRAAMANLKVDTKGLRGGPIEWTKDNHFRTQQSYRVYRWDGGKTIVVQGLDDLRREVGRAPHRPRRASRALRCETIVQLVVNIIVLSSIYALIACGYVLIYRVSRVLNLAHGELMMLGAYLLLATAWLFAAARSPAIASRSCSVSPSACWSMSS